MSTATVLILPMLFLYFSYYSCNISILKLITTTSYSILSVLLSRQITNISSQISYCLWGLLDRNFSAILEEVCNEKILCWNKCYSSEEWPDRCIIPSLYKGWEMRLTRGNQRVNFSFCSSSIAINTCLFQSRVSSTACNHISV